ncbi:MAG TPA: DUF1176 domain-containing protein [Pseudoxanthomonas sp.]
MTLSFPLAANDLIRVPLYKTFGEWIVVCDAVRLCLNHGVTDDISNTYGNAIRITRAPGPNGEIMIERLIMKDLGEHEVEVIAAGSEQEKAISEIDKLLVTPLNKDMGPNTIPEDLLDSLAFIDSVQGRIGTRTAFVKRGNSPDAVIPPAHALPLVRPSISHWTLSKAEEGTLTSQVRQLKATDLRKERCEERAILNDAAFPLGDREVLIKIGCFAASYTESSLIFRMLRGKPRSTKRISLPTEDEANREDAPMLSDYSSGTGTLGSYYKSGGLGDYGMERTWIFDGKSFLLSAVSQMPYSLGLLPDDWPTMVYLRADLDEE